MKTQETTTISRLTQTSLGKSTKPISYTERFIDWFRNFLESSE